MEIPIKCPCGSTYTVDETPVNGHLCFPVSCPRCRRDGTELANDYIRQAASRQANKGSAGSPSPAILGSARLGLGVAGACVGGIAGMLAWYFITRWTGYEIGYVAWGVGVLAGVGARLAMPSGSFGLAGIAALAAATAIVGGQYLGLRHRLDERIDMATSALYDATSGYAKKAVKATSDLEIELLLEKSGFRSRDLAPGENAVTCKKRLLPLVAFLFKGVMKDGSAPDLVQRIDEVRAESRPTDKDVESFKPAGAARVERISGRQTLARRIQQNPRRIRPRKPFLQRMLVESWSPYQLLWLVLGIGSAWRLAYNKSETE